MIPKTTKSAQEKESSEKSNGDDVDEDFLHQISTNTFKIKIMDEEMNYQASLNSYFNSGNNCSADREERVKKHKNFAILSIPKERHKHGKGLDSYTPYYLYNDQFVVFSVSKVLK